MLTMALISLVNGYTFVKQLLNHSRHHIGIFYPIPAVT